MEQIIEIPAQLVDPLLILAAEQEVSVEEIITKAITNLIERSDKCGR